MLFNSYEFIFLFVPVVWIGYRLLAASGSTRPGTWWLAISSIIFYAYSGPQFLPALFASIGVNFTLTRLLAAGPPEPTRRRRALLVVGIVFSLSLLGYFKYTNFLFDNIEAAFGWSLALGRIILPIGISFYTFQQIALLVDAYRGRAEKYDLGSYCLFVTFFPQLIAGPIVHYKEMMPQFARRDPDSVPSKLAVGLTVFVIGLFKKVVIADTAAVASDLMFREIAGGAAPTLIESWLGMTSYAFQIYFDFSAYSDMAIGLGWMFGIRLPINFASPYKATSIADFWRRWHITLSRFLRDYLYIPLGGNRLGKNREYVNVFATMLLGGIWHGAGWNFVLWGTLHGLFLMADRLWRERRSGTRRARSPWPGRLLTFTCVLVAWVPFRAPDWATTLEVYRGMAGVNGLAPGDVGTWLAGAMFSIGWVAALLVWVWSLPNAQELMGSLAPGLPSRAYPATAVDAVPRRLAWRPNLLYSLSVAAAFFIAIVMINRESPFIYFQF